MIIFVLNVHVSLLHYSCRGSTHDRRLRSLPTVNGCLFSIILKLYFQPQHNAVNPLAVLSLLRCNLILPLLLYIHHPLRGYVEQRRASARRGEVPHVNICRIPRILLSQDWNPACSPRFAGLFSTRGGLFVCFFRYRARLPRPHPGRACPVVY